MSRSGIYDEKYGFIPDADEPQTYLCDSCSLFPCDDSGVKMERRCFAYSPIPKPQTNADRIRAMTDEELAVQIALPYLVSPPWCYEHRTCPYISEDPAPCDRCALDWLKQEGE